MAPRLGQPGGGSGAGRIGAGIKEELVKSVERYKSNLEKIF